MLYECFFSILFKNILDQISGEKHLKLSLAEFVYILAAVTFFGGCETERDRALSYTCAQQRKVGDTG